VAFAAVLSWIGISSASPGLSLRAVDVGGQLRIDWNHKARVIQQSESGVLEIEDGLVKVHDELSPEHLRAGNITYLRTTGTVLVRLLVRGANQRTLTEMTRFLGPPVATAAPIATNSAGLPAKKDSIDAAPVPRATEQDADRMEPVAAARPANDRQSNDRPANRKRGERVPTKSVRQAPAASAPPRRRLAVPPAAVPRPAEPLFPAPPVITANAGTPAATFIPRLPAPVIPTPAQHGPATGIDPGPAAGTMIWTGKLSRSGTVRFSAVARRSDRSPAIAGAPVGFESFPLNTGRLAHLHRGRQIGRRPEAPERKTAGIVRLPVLNPRKAGEIRILENPGQQNDWNRLTLRAERGDHSIIFIRWERLPAEAAPRTAGGQ
jgi:hypothetical protein